MTFLEVMNNEDRLLLLSLDFVELDTFHNGSDEKRYLFLVSSNVEREHLDNIGLSMYCLTNSIDF